MDFREKVQPRAAFRGEDYWRKPVPGFGDINGRLLIIGIAPAAHGGNRTGRVFTGDSSGRFLVKALHAAGFANQDSSESRTDGLVYIDCFLTAAVKCVPPGDRPSRDEFANCSEFLEAEIKLMRGLEAVLTLGALSFKAYLNHLRINGRETKSLEFRHRGVYHLDGSPTIYASYHPSPRNTNTGRLTQPMLVRVIKSIRADLGGSLPPSKDN